MLDAIVANGDLAEDLAAGWLERLVVDFDNLMQRGGSRHLRQLYTISELKDLEGQIGSCIQ
jgi:hypothetical protein